MTKKIIRFRPVNGQLVAEAIGFQGKGCETALKKTLGKMGLTPIEGSEDKKPEYLLNESQEKSVVTG
jgi:hypothetical protein